MMERGDLIISVIFIVSILFSGFIGYYIAVDSMEFKQKTGSVIIQKWGDNIYLLIKPFTGGFYSDHETLADAVLSALELYNHHQINKIFFDLDRNGVPDETFFEKNLNP